MKNTNHKHEFLFTGYYEDCKCGAEHSSKNTAAKALGSIRTKKKAISSRKNGKLGGRPKRLSPLPDK